MTKGFGFSEEDEDLDNEDAIGPLDEDEMSKLDGMMGGGLGAGAHQRKTGGNSGVYRPDNLKKGGIQDHISSRKNPGQITDDELETFMEEFERDPQGQTKKQLYRMLLADRQYINDLYDKLSDANVGTKQAADIRKLINDATENMLEITKALRLQPQQNKDDGDTGNIATIAEMYEEHRRKRGADMKAEGEAEGKARQEADLYDLQGMEMAQRRKIWQQTHPEMPLPPELREDAPPPGQED
jgi:hypothetical protein